MGRRGARAGAYACAAVALAALTASLLPAAGCGSRSEAAAVGQPAIGFSSFDLEGRPVKLSDFRGKVVLLNFWASWCGPCRKEFPRLAAVHGQGDVVVVVGVLYDDTKAAARRFAAGYGATWPSVVDPSHEIAHAYRAGPGIPVTWVIDRAGVARARHIGELTESDLDRLVRSGG